MKNDSPSSPRLRPHTLDSQESARPRRNSKAFTLMEVLLTLAILVTVSVLATANFRSGFRVQRLKKAADKVRTAWAQARVDAIKTGRVHVFYHAVEGNRYFSAPQTSYDDPIQALNGNGAMASGFGTNAGSNVGAASSPGMMANENMPGGVDVTFTVEHQELPQEILFLGADVRIDQRASLQLNQTPVTEDLGGLGMSDATGEFEEIRWGTPIFFFPNGTSSSAQLVLSNGQQQMVRVYLRGLTGIARVGEVESGGSSLSPTGAMP